VKKNWKNSYGRNDLAAHEWKSVDWAAAKGLYANTLKPLKN
jgi:methylglutaconyl-CoA hydratase